MPSVHDVFFGTAESAPIPREDVNTARAFCYAGCPVRSECLSYALHTDEVWGVWGGLTRPERERAMEHYQTVPAVLDALDDGTLEGVVRRR